MGDQYNLESNYTSEIIKNTFFYFIKILYINRLNIFDSQVTGIITNIKEIKKKKLLLHLLHIPKTHLLPVIAFLKSPPAGSLLS